MLNSGRSLLATIAILSLSAALTGCPLPNVGGQGNDAPVAVAVAAPVTGTSPDLNARSQTEITLSGRDSYDPDGVIQSFQWKQVEGTPSLALSKANNSTSTVSLPKVFSPTTFKFELTVTDDKGATGTDTITVTANPPADPDRFLTLLEVPDTFKVVAATASTLGTASQPFTINVATTIDYNVYVDGVAEARTKTITQSASSSWSADGAGGQSKDDYRNPWYTFDLPKVKLKDLLADLKDNERIYPTVRNNLQVTTTVTLSASGIPTYLYVLDQSGNIIGQSAGTPDATLSFKSSDATLDALFAQKTPQGSAIDEQENEATAKAYYAAIDPGNDKDTLSKWKAANGFVDGDPNTVEATYINGFDLGFARHMYMRQDEFGNVYTYVINAPNIESADSNVNTIAAVAMEYSPAPGALPSDTNKYTKFYTFVLNPITGEQDRVTTMDFDGRGEKYQPGTCLDCHGGKPAALSSGVYPNNGDLRNSASGSLSPGFLPWDVSTLYFSDDDFDNGTHLTQPTAAQLEAFRKFNEMVLLTNPSDTVKSLIHGWYGVTDPTATTLPADATFNANFIPDGWLPGSTGGPSDADADKARTLYLQVVGPYCRACHAQRTEKTTISFATYDDFIGYASEGVGGIPNLVFDTGVMPLARHTMDEFWRSDTTASPASVLASTLGLADYRMPGTPIAAIDSVIVNGTTVSVTGGAVTANRVSGAAILRLNGDASLFAKTMKWTLTDKPAGSSATLVGDTTRNPALRADFTGPYTITLVVNNGVADSLPVTLTVTVADNLPIAFNDSAATSPTSPVTINVLSNDQLGTQPTQITAATNGAHGTVNIINASTGTISYTPSSSSFTGNDSFTYTITDSNSNTSTASVQVTITALPAAANDSQSISTKTTASYSPTALSVLSNDGLGTTPTTITAVTNGAHGTVARVNGNTQTVYTPSPYYIGSDSYTYTITDSASKTSTATVNVTVNPNSGTKLQEIQSGIFDPYCSGCHNSSGDYPTLSPVDYATVTSSTFIDKSSLPASGKNSLLINHPASTSHSDGIEPGFGNSSGACFGATGNTTDSTASNCSNYNKILQWIREGAPNN